MELDHNPTIHQQAKAEVKSGEKTCLRNIIQPFHIRKDIYEQVQKPFDKFSGKAQTRSSLQKKRLEIQQED
jgi:hypothetical protein